MKTYLVTGVAGFIASRVAQMLLEEGHQVVGVDSMNDSCDVRIKQWRVAQLRPQPRFTFLEGNICDRAAMASLFGAHTFDGVINLAARAGVRYSVENPWIYYETNVTGALVLLELCREHGIRKFVHASSSSVYGDGVDLPYSEDQPTDHPLSPYAASKKASEALCHAYYHLHHIDITVFRYFTVYGPAGRPDMSPLRFVQWIAEGVPLTIYGDGTQSRDFTFVDDIARGTIAGLRPVGFEVVNLGSDTPVVLLDMIRTLERQLGKPAHLEFQERHRSDVEATWADISKAKRLLDWQPQVSFEAGMQALVSWYQTHREWAKDIETRPVLSV